MNRRKFGKVMVGAAALSMGRGSLVATEALAEPALSALSAPFRFSLMLWTMNKVTKDPEAAIDIAAQAGYQGVELVGEYKKWTDADYLRIMKKVTGAGMQVDSMAGVRGFADATAVDLLLKDLGSAFAVADRLNCNQIILTSGKAVGTATPHETSLETLKRVTELAEKANKQIVIEPIDKLENPNASLISVTEGFEIARAIGSPHLRVLYDVYHEQRQAGNLLEKFDNIDLVGLIHIADVPGRHEPGTGEIRYDAIYRKLGKLKYSHFVAMEFYPTGEPVATLRAAREQAIAAANLA